MEFKLQLIISNDTQPLKTIDLTTLAKSTTTIAELGLSLADSKNILKSMQSSIITEQVSHYLANCRCCPDCYRDYKIKDHKIKKLNTLFGTLHLESPRFYSCQCYQKNRKSFCPLSQLITDRNTPELLYIESKYASLVSYGLTTKLLIDFLPIHSKLNAVSIRNDTLKVAKRLDEKLGEEHYFFVEGCPYEWERLPQPKGKITMGIDGGYLREWENKKKNFEVIAGKSLPSQGDAKYFGLVQRFDKKPKRRVYEVLKSQGMQNNQVVEFLSDGADNLRELQRFLNPRAKHMLDWFHVSMRFTVLMNYAKGYKKYDRESGTELIEELESAKWHGWHGHAQECYEQIESATWTINPESKYPPLKKLEKALDEMCTYIYRNSPMIVNYSERWHAGDRISTGFIESTINCFVTKRFAKKQQMQWTAKGAHLLMQIRAKVMNNEFATEFKNWYPEFHDYIEKSINDDKILPEKVAA